ncbi:RDD family protein [Planococcus sp. APC 4015]|nr:RDD family protein [Planococcus sp. APC 4015]
MTQPASAQIAPISRRAIGYLIDAFIATGLAIVLGGGLVIVATLAGGVEATLTTLLIGGPIVSLLLLAWFVIYTRMQAGAGSIGMRAQGLRLVSARDEAPLGFGRALLRNIIFGLACSIVVGYFTPLFDGSGRFQGWHDKVAGSLMTSARATAAAPAPASDTADAAAPTPARPAMPAAPPVPPAPPVAAPAPVFSSPTVPAAATPRPAPAGDGSLIAFVPGISQDAPPPRAVPADPVSDLDATVQGDAALRFVAPATSAAPATPAAPVTPVEPAAPAAPAARVEPAPPVAQPAPDADDVEHTRISVPGHRLVFTWDDGSKVSVSRRTIFGRNPSPEDGAVVVAVRDETLSLSKTHFEAAAESSGGWVLDRHSTNGMTLVRDGRRIACPAGQRVPVRLGDAIEIGDRIVTIGGYA